MPRLTFIPCSSTLVILSYLVWQRRGSWFASHTYVRSCHSVEFETGPTPTQKALDLQDLRRTLTSLNLLPRGATHLEAKRFTLCCSSWQIHRSLNSASHMQTYRFVGTTLASLMWTHLYDVFASVECFHAIEVLLLFEALILAFTGSLLSCDLISCLPLLVRGSHSTCLVIVSLSL